MSKTFFVLSMGRSGTTSLCSYLSYAKNAVIVHEPPGMGAYNNALTENEKLGRPIAQQELFEHYYKKGIDQILDSGKKYADLSPTLYHVAEGILQTYPDSKIVWVLRDPRTWIRSTLHAGWQFGNFRRNCWYWSKVAAHLWRAYFEKAKESQRCMVKIEEMSPEKRYDLYKWLDLEPCHEGVEEWMSQTFSEHKYRGPLWVPQAENWNDSQWDAFNDYIRPKWEGIAGLYEKERLWQKDGTIQKQ